MPHAAVGLRAVLVQILRASAVQELGFRRGRIRRVREKTERKNLGVAQEKLDFSPA